jgi:branched-chain amino acid transport system ATP-binding protein
LRLKSVKELRPFAIAMEISNRVIVMGHGKLVFEGTPDELRANDKIRQEWLEV